MTREEYIKHQRDALLQRVLDLEADVVMLQVALNEAQARIAELEAAANLSVSPPQAADDSPIDFPPISAVE